MSLLKDVWDIVKDRVEWKEVQTAARKVPELERRIAALESQIQKQPSGQVCDHCGSSDTLRIGARPNATFGDLGAKDAIFRCGACGGETAVLIDR